MRGAAQAEARYHPRFWWAVRRGVGDFYDRLGLTVTGSFVFFLALGWLILSLATARSLPLSLALLHVAAAYVGLCFAWMGNVLVAHRIASFEEPGLDAFTSAIRVYGAGVLKLAGVCLTVTLVLLFDAAFFVTRPSRPLQVLGVIVAYLLLVWLVSMLWQWQFLVVENSRTMRILKKSALVVLDNPIFTLAAFFVTIPVGLLLLATGIGGVAALGGLASCFLVRAHREILKKYDMVEDEPEVVEDAGWPGSGGPPRRLNPRQPYATKLVEQGEQDTGDSGKP